MRPPFPHQFDSSLIAAFRSCFQKGNLEYIEHWKPKEGSVHLVAGAAYASGLEGARTAFFQEGRSKSESEAIGLRKLMHSYGDFQCPTDSPKSLERTAGALEFYFERYPLDNDHVDPITLPNGRRGVELSFNEPIDLEDPMMLHPETGDPLLYCGRADLIGNFQNMVMGLDDKTTSQLGATWPRQWDLRSQFTSYSWGFGRIGVKLDGWLIRGVSILKTKYDTMEAITYRPQWMIDRWHHQLKRDITKIRFAWESGYYDYSLDHACSEYGGCMFRQACLMRQPEALMEQQFERRRWDPVNRIEIPIKVIEGEFVEQHGISTD